MRGIEHYISEPGFHCIRLHYTADPDKDPATPKGAAWIENEVKGIPGKFASAQWRQEYEIDWDAAGGELVFPQLDIYESVIVCKPFTVPETWSLYGSFDYGHRNPSSFHVYAMDHDGDVWVVWEYYRSGRGYKEISKSIRSCPYFGKMSYLPIADPSIWAKNQQNQLSGDSSEMKSIAQLFFELPAAEQIVFAPGKAGGDVTVAEKINGEMWYVPNEEDRPKNWTFKPRIHIFATCSMMIWELKKLRYKDWSGSMQEERNLQESIVDKDNHAFDDLKMFFTMFFMAPSEAKDDSLEKLKKEDPASYTETIAVRKMFGEESSTKGTMGDFEAESGDGESEDW